MLSAELVNLLELRIDLQSSAGLLFSLILSAEYWGEGGNVI